MTLKHTTEAQILETIKQLSTKLIANKTHLLSVESCTGGGLGYYCTSQSGSSLWYAGGHITYSNTSKMNLGVPSNLLDNYGAVSE
ncbi:MAG: CinA family protein, partial [Gammaproteobacteria bacterium]|nr:CinA family protein [Gammaproteobacteria bacterium]